MPSLELIEAFLAPQVILFLLFAVGALATALTMLFHPNPVRAALFLVLNLFCVAVLYLLLNAYFLAAVQVVVYAGAIMVLFLFVIMLLNLGTPDRTKDRLSAQQPLAVITGLVLAVVLASILVRSAKLPVLNKNGDPVPMTSPQPNKKSPITVAGNGQSSTATAPDDTKDEAWERENTALIASSRQGTVDGVGKILYNPALPYLFPFEVTSILLLVATIGSVVLAKRRLPDEQPLAGEDIA